MKPPHEIPELAGSGSRSLPAIARLAVVGLLHLGAFALMLHGVARHPELVPPRLVTALILPAPAPQAAPAQPPKPVVSRPPPTVAPPRPKPRVQPQKPVPTAPEPSLAAATPPASAAEQAPADSVPVGAPVQPLRIPPKVSSSHSCEVPDYPPLSRRLGETGIVVVRFLIDPNGTVIDSAIDSTSGFARLDEAARRALSLCRFTPGTVDGKPEAAWARIRYVWKLE